MMSNIICTYEYWVLWCKKSALCMLFCPKKTQYGMIGARTCLRPCTAQKHSSYLPVLERTKSSGLTPHVLQIPNENIRKHLCTRNNAPFMFDNTTLTVGFNWPSASQLLHFFRLHGLYAGCGGFLDTHKQNHREIQDRQTATVSIIPSCHKFMSPTYHHIPSHTLCLAKVFVQLVIQRSWCLLDWLTHWTG